MKMPRKRVLVIEDDPDAQRHIADAVVSAGCFELAAAVPDLTSGRQVLATTPVDVLLTDLQLPDGHGAELIRATRVNHPHVLSLVITVFGDERSVVASVLAGASGYLLKDSTREELADSLRALVDGGAPLSPSVARYVLKLARSAPAAADDPARSAPAQLAARPRLSARETEVLELLAKGFTPAEIAPLLHISAHTVVTHTRNIHRKLEVSSRSAAIFEAVAWGLIKLGA